MVSYFFFQTEDGIRDAQESRGLGDVYKRQVMTHLPDYKLARLVQSTARVRRLLTNTHGHVWRARFLRRWQAAPEAEDLFGWECCWYYAYCHQATEQGLDACY
eukprot:TRINITY_DN50841_c0_g1_i1.p1 TRINITY_DN50841_c0_g1~~TRINITY_DN50841_c0_g1_i1.p1  ORF type:complete len:103 (-),score=21.85 TRINITY_DN50841_c0_g1_i1:425-733(-)